MNTLEYIFRQDDILSTLRYSDYECGELEALRTELDNTQKMLTNLIQIIQRTHPKITLDKLCGENNE